MRAVGVALVLLAALACESEPAVWLRGERIVVEVADTPARQRVGLMFRESLAPDRGMLFVFPDARPRSFWMKNTVIPLDILYFDSERRLLRVHAEVPPCAQDPCPGYPSGGPARYVLELRGGRAAELGAQEGDELRLALE